jgi:aspartyl-tRNA(Asn)/glutamyl-tRNA(Gln) amidotransferase subunit C
MPITLDEVRHVARLARLELTEDELRAFQTELDALLGHFQDVQAVDVTGVAPKPHAVALQNVLAEDVARFGLTRDQALANAPKSRAGLFLVPSIRED